MDKACKICGKIFNTHNTVRLYCSLRCRKEVARLYYVKHRKENKQQIRAELINELIDEISIKRYYGKDQSKNRIIIEAKCDGHNNCLDQIINLLESKL
jgi:hypothetical protein